MKRQRGYIVHTRQCQNTQRVKRDSFLYISIFFFKLDNTKQPANVRRLAFFKLQTDKQVIYNNIKKQIENKKHQQQQRQQQQQQKLAFSCCQEENDDEGM